MFVSGGKFKKCDLELFLLLTTLKRKPCLCVRKCGDDQKTLYRHSLENIMYDIM